MAFPSTPLDVLVEMAIGADPAAHPDTWVWTDITQWVLVRDQIILSRGKPDRFAQAPPGQMRMTVDDTGGRFVVRNPSGPYYGRLRRNVPVRVSVDGVPRATMFADTLPVGWDVSGRDKYVTLTASGILKRLGRSSSQIVSAPRAYIPTTGPIAYWSLEDGELAAYGTPDVGRNRMTSWTGKHPSGAVATFAKWGTGGLGPWLPNVFSFPASSGLAIIAGRVDMPGSPATWTVDFMYAGNGADSVFLDINPSYLTDNSAGWPQLTLDPVARELLVSFGGEPETSSSTPGLYDGLGHHIRLTARQAGAKIAWTAYIDGIEAQTDTTSGSFTLAPIEALGLVGDQASSDAVGHLAVWTNPPSVLAAAAAGLGYLGEPAGRRIERLCDEQAVPLSVVDEYRIRDTFNRTVANNLGTADTGEAWTLSGGTAADFDVAAGEATITQGSTTVVRAGVVGNAVNAFDARVLVEVPALSTGGSVGISAGVVFRWVSDTDHYRAQIDFTPFGTMVFGLNRAGGAGISLGTTSTIPGTYTAGDRFWVHVRGRGALFYGRAWRESEVEPSTWLARDDDELAVGKVGFFARRGTGDTTVSNTYTFSQFSADSALDDTQLMGAQPYQAFLPVVREAEDVDGGILAEATTGPLEYLVGRDRYNRAVDLALDYDQGHVAPPFEPSDDDTDLRNEVVASRAGGGSDVARYADDAHIAAEGRYDEGITLNVADDGQLEDQAAWRVHLGTVPEMRYPRLSLNFARNPALGADWLTCRLSSRITIDNPPPELPPDLIDLHVVGYTETLEPFAWRVEANAAPASPYTVGVWEDTVLGRADTDGSVVVGDFVAGTGTVLPVAVTAGNLWVTTAGNPAEFPFAIRTGGAELTVTAITSTAKVLNGNPYFESTASPWSSPDATVARSTAQAHQGTASLLLTPTGAAAAARAESESLPVVPGLSYRHDVWVRCAASRNVECNIAWYSAGSVFLSLSTTSTAVTANTWAQLGATYTAPAGAVAGRLQVRLTGTPLASHTTHIDQAEMTVVGSQTMTVTQAAVNGATNTIPAGTDVRLAHPMIAGL